MKTVREYVAVLSAMLLAAPTAGFASNHREAPITAVDRSADITDVYAFASYDRPGFVTLIMNVDPLLEPGNGPTYFPFDQDILYAINVDNDYDGVADLSFQFRFQTEVRAPNVFTAYIGAGTGVNAPANAPGGNNALGAGAALIPPAVTSLDGPGSAGLNLRQRYIVNLVRVNGGSRANNGVGANGSTNAGLGVAAGPGVSVADAGGEQTSIYSTTSLTPTNSSLFVVPANVGPRTMPNYTALAQQGIYTLQQGARVFAGTVDDPFFIDLGGTFDSLNLRGPFPSGTVGVLTPAQDADLRNIAPDSVAGYNVNTIALEVPMQMLTSTGQMPTGPNDRNGTIGVWATTSRPRDTIRRTPAETVAGLPSGTTTGCATVSSTQPCLPAQAGATPTDYRQVQRMGNPLINEVLIGVGFKDTFSTSQPANDSQFANFFLDPLLARALNAVFGVNVPPAPRTDLLPLVTYRPPIAAAGTTAGPVADLLRLNLGVPPTPPESRSRLGALAGDLGGYPNGRRVTDDVVDISLRAVAGVLAGAPYNSAPNSLLGDGVNSNNDLPPGVTNVPLTQETFPYVRFANSGRDTPSRPTQNSCITNPMQLGCR